MNESLHGGDIYALPNQNEIMDFSVNVNPLGIHPAVRQAALRSIDDCGRYPDSQCRTLTEKIAKKEGVPCESVVCGNGAADIIFRLATALRPAKALLLAPTFSEYESALLSVGCEISFFMLKEENDFRLTDDILNHITPQIQILFLCNPNNPDGQLINRRLMQRILKKCKQTGTILVVDECFNDFLFEPEKHSLKGFLKEYPNLFLLKAFTKVFAVPGLRLGYGLCMGEAIIDAVKRSGQAWSVSVVAQAAGAAALEQADYVSQTSIYIAKERQWMKERLKDLGFYVFDARANFILVRCKDKHLKETLLKSNILIRCCANYKGLRAGYYRFAVKTEQENRRLTNAIKKGKDSKEIIL